MIVTSVCSRREWTHSTVLYGSTTAVATCGHDQTVNLLCSLRLECLGLGTAGLCLLGESLLLDGLCLLLVDSLDENTLVLEDVTLAFHVERVVQVLVDLL